MFSKNKDDFKAYCAVYDVINHKFMSVGFPSLHEHPGVTEVITKENGKVVSHTLTISTCSLESLITNCIVYVCDSSNALE